MCGFVKTSRSVGKSQLRFDNELINEPLLNVL